MMLFCDGFDQYGPPGQATPTVASLLAAGIWNTVTGAPTIVTGLSATGQAIANGSGIGVTKTLAANYARLIGGVRFSSTLGGGSQGAGLTFYDGGTGQCSLTVNASTGTLSVRTGQMNGTALGTSSSSVSANTTHYLEWDITIGAAGAYQVWLDGVLILGAADRSTTGNTRGGATHDYANAVYLGAAGVTSNQGTFDDFYLFDSTGATNSAVLLNNPVVETSRVSADSAVQWTPGATALGVDTSATASTNAPGANQIFLRTFTPPVNMTLNSVSCRPQATSGAAKFKAVLYAGITAGSAVIATGAEVTGTTSGSTLTSTFSSPPALTGGTPYTIGFITDTSVVLAQVDATTTGSKAANTYGSGAPGTLPAMTAGQVSWQIWGNCVSAAANYPALQNNPGIDDLSFVSDGTVNHEDLYSFASLSSNPASVACVTFAARVKRSDSGTRTVDVRCSSSGNDSAGSASGFTPGSSFGWVASNFAVDPNTGVAWTGTGVNAALGGVKVAS